MGILSCAVVAQSLVNQPYGMRIMAVAVMRWPSARVQSPPTSRRRPHALTASLRMREPFSLRRTASAAQHGRCKDIGQAFTLAHCERSPKDWRTPPSGDETEACVPHRPEWPYRQHERCRRQPEDTRQAGWRALSPERQRRKPSYGTLSLWHPWEGIRGQVMTWPLPPYGECEAASLGAVVHQYA
jgi:hypothetical protein